MRPLTGFMRKEVRHILRDRRTLAILLLLPVAQVLLFGFAVRTDIREIRLAVVDPAPDAASLSLQARFRGTELFRMVEAVPATAALPDLFETGRIHQALVFPGELEKAMARPGGATLQLITDATDPNTGSTMQAYADGVVQGWLRERAGSGRGGSAAGGSGAGVGGGGSRLAGEGGPVVLVPRVRMRFNPTLESVNLFVPGLIAVLLTVVSALMTAISLSREKERGTLEVLLVSPLRPREIIVGKVLPYLGLGFLNVASVLLMAVLVFHVPFRGSLPLLVVESLLFIVASMGLGVLIAALTRSQRAAMIGSLMGLMLPTLLLSGMIFPIASMPSWLQFLSNGVPGRWFLVVARGVMLKGVGLAELWEETLILAGMTAVVLAAAIRAFDIRLS